MIELIFGLWLATWRPEYAQVDPALRQWFREQRAPGASIPCCDEADGTKAAEDMRYDPDGTRHYWATFVIKGENGFEEKIEFMRVPDEAVLEKGPNPVGQPIVWWHKQNGIVQIRCYKPGPKA